MICFKQLPLCSALNLAWRIIAVLIVTAIALNSKVASAAPRAYYMYFNSGTTLTQPAVTTNAVCPKTSDTVLNGVSGISLMNDVDDTVCVPASNRDLIWNSASPTFSLYYKGAGYTNAVNITGTSVGLSIRTVAATGTLTVKLFYTTSSNVKVYFTGTPVTQAATSTRTNYNINLSGLSANNVPAGSKIGIEFSWPTASTGIRLSINSGVNNEKLIVNETIANPIVPVAEYRFDESVWSGASGQVVDTIASNNGTSMNGTFTTNSTGIGQGICRLGVFDGSNDYVEITSLYDKLKGTFSMSAWLNTTQIGNNIDWQAPGITGVEENGGQNDIFIGWLDANGRIGLNVKNDTSFTSTSSVNNGQWHHVVFTRDMDTGITKIYVDGALQATRTQGTGLIGNTFNGIGIVRNTSAIAPIYFNGKLDEILIFSNVLTDANVTQIYTNQNVGKNWDGTTRTCPIGLDHIQIEHPSGNGVTCTPSTLTLKACADVACTTLYTGGVTGTLTTTGTGTANWGGATADFTIPAIGSVSKTLQLTSANTNVSTILGTTSITPPPVSATKCNFTNCTYSADNAGLIFDIPNHIAATTQTVAISAVKKADNSNACVPAFANVTRTLQMACNYNNPMTGSLPVQLNGIYLNSTNSASAMCAANNPVSLTFNSAGTANASVNYPDVGSMTLNISYSGSAVTGDSGLLINGADGFIAAPKDFVFSNITAAPIKAGNNFSATVTARNANNIATPNFGKEISAEHAVLSFHKCQPTGANAVNGVFSGNLAIFNGGSASSSNLNWSEVGKGDLSATLTSGNYLTSGFTVVGNTGNSASICNGAGNIGRFIPDHFDTVVTQGCSSGSFTYSAQPFVVQVTARNLSNAKTQNYDGTINTSPNFSKDTVLSDANAVATGSLASASVAASTFTAGIANATPSFNFNTAKTAPATIRLHALDLDNVASSTTEGTAIIRSGRLNLQNAYGSELLALPIPLEAQFWNGSAYIRNQQDSCTIVPASSIAMSNYRNNLAACETQLGYSSGTGNLVNGAARNLRLTKPGAGNNGSVDLKLNLTSASGSTCNTATSSAASSANIPWFGVNPSSRATFGIYKTPIIYLRENF